MAAFDTEALQQAVQQAVTQQQLTASAAENINSWLVEPRYAMYAGEVAEHINNQQWQALDDAFWTVIPFGTGGRRGRMYPIGSNAINDRTIGESAQGLAAYTAEQNDVDDLRCAIAYDTRHRSRHFAELCAGIMVANGFTVYFLDGYRSTPELSYLVRYKKCHCGIMVTASHNPPSDNAVKVYWSTGGQVLPPHDAAIIDRVMTTQEIRSVPFDQALADARVVMCNEEVDAAFLDQVVAQSRPGSRDLKIIYSPLHGVGVEAVPPVLAKAGFEDVEVFQPHAEPSGDFPNVPNHVSNPENPAVFDAIIQRAQEVGGELILATDPDCDRMGCAAPLTLEAGSPWATFSGNQLGALLTDYTLSTYGTLTSDHYVVKTLVTTELIRRIADSYGVQTEGNLMVGFKYIGGVMEDRGAERFVFGTEESHGYLVGQYARDKDGAVACMLMSELAAKAKQDGQSVHEKLAALHWQFGYHGERLMNITMEGSQGMVQMQALMERFRTQPPKSLAGLPVAVVRDYLNLKRVAADGSEEPLDGPQGNLLMLDLGDEGNYIGVRPSGTEPKVKFYMFTYCPPELIADLEDTRSQMQQRLDQLEADLREFAAAD